VTAELVVMNKGAVALAADSAATTLMGSTVKTSTSADKIFALSVKHPVAIMI
jgi:hypothetical protein